MIPQYQGEGAGARESPSQYTYLPCCSYLCTLSVCMQLDMERTCTTTYLPDLSTDALCTTLYTYASLRRQHEVCMYHSSTRELEYM